MSNISRQVTSMPKDEHKGEHICLSFQEPFATYIATGQKTVECRSKRKSTPVKDLVVCASKTPSEYEHIPGLVYGYAIGLVDLVDCVPFSAEHYSPAMMTWGGDGNYAWILENPRLIKPFPVHATAGFFYVKDKPQVIATVPRSYRRCVLPFAYRDGTRDGKKIEDLVIESLFGDRSLAFEIFQP